MFFSPSYSTVTSPVGSLFENNIAYKKPKTPKDAELLGNRLLCPGNPIVYSIKEKIRGTIMGWEVSNGMITTKNYGNQIAVVWNLPSSKVPYTLKVWRQSIKNPKEKSDDLIVDLDIEPVDLTISGLTDVTSNSESAYSVLPVTGDFYKWELFPPEAGSILTQNPINEIKVLWNNQETVQYAKIRLVMHKCKVSFFPPDMGLVVKIQPQKSLKPLVTKFYTNNAKSEDSIGVMVKKESEIKYIDFPDPVFTFNNNVCINEPVFFKITSSINEGDTFEWEFDHTETLKTPHAIKTFKNGGQHFVKLTVINKYGISKSKTEWGVNIFSNEEQGAIFCNPAIVEKCNTIEVQYVPYQKNLNVMKVQWMKDNKEILGANQLKYKTQNGGNYWVKVTNANGCIYNCYRPVSPIFTDKK